MPKYFEIVRYVKENHVDWNTDVFDILKGYFSEYSPQVLPSPSDDVILVPDDIHTPYVLAYRVAVDGASLLLPDGFAQS